MARFQGGPAVLTTFPIFYAICMRNHRIIIGSVVEGSVTWAFLNGSFSRRSRSSGSTCRKRRSKIDVRSWLVRLVCSVMVASLIQQQQSVPSRFGYGWVRLVCSKGRGFSHVGFLSQRCVKPQVAPDQVIGTKKKKKNQIYIYIERERENKGTAFAKQNDY